MSLAAYQIDWIIWGLLGLSLVALLMPLAFVWLHRKFEATIPGPNGPQTIRSFFQIPYITWFLIHKYVSVLVLIALVGLAVGGWINSATLAGLLGSLLGYVLGSAAGHSMATSAPQKPASNDGGKA